MNPPWTFGETLAGLSVDGGSVRAAVFAENRVAAMVLITNGGIRGALPLSICLLCLTLMWLEAVLGLCLGCEIHGVLVRRGWCARDDAFEICAGGACKIERTGERTGERT